MVSVQRLGDNGKSSPFVVSREAEDLLEAGIRSVKKNGFVFIDSMLSGDEMDIFAKSLIGHTDSMINNPKVRGLEVGSSNGYHEICVRSKDRFDVPTFVRGRDAFNVWSEEKAFPLSLIEDIEKMCSQILEEDVPDRAFSGCVAARPGCPAQFWHADSPHQQASHASANLVNVLVALHDTSIDLGPTELVPGSHIATNHLSSTGDRAFSKKAPNQPPDIVYQFETNSPESIGLDSVDAFTMDLRKGSVLIFDDRTLHRGLGNRTEDVTRYVAYFSWKKNHFEPETHFEASKSIFD